MRIGRQPRDCTLPDLQRYSPRFDKRALRLLTPEAGVARRAVAGGTAHRSVAEALKETSRWLDSL
jgi:argininosuccinate lyase